MLHIPHLSKEVGPSYDLLVLDMLVLFLSSGAPILPSLSYALLALHILEPSLDYPFWLFSRSVFLHATLFTFSLGFYL